MFLLNYGHNQISIPAGPSSDVLVLREHRDGTANFFRYKIDRLTKYSTFVDIIVMSLTNVDLNYVAYCCKHCFDVFLNDNCLYYEV